MTTESARNGKPQKCPQCGQNKFIALKPEKGIGNMFLCIFAFVLDLFSRGVMTSIGLEAMNKRRSGWMCKNCGWEQRTI